MRHAITLTPLLLMLAATAPSRAADALSFDLLPATAAGVAAPSPAATAPTPAADDCRTVTELQLLPTTTSGWFALLDVAVRGLCDLNVLPEPRAYRLLPSAEHGAHAFSGNAASGASVDLRFQPSGQITLTETRANGETRHLTGTGTPAPMMALGHHALRAASGEPATLALCLELNPATGRALAWLSAADADDCRTALPTRLYPLQRRPAADGTIGYSGLWITADGAYQLAITLDAVGAASAVTETTPAGDAQAWQVVPPGS